MRRRVSWVGLIVLVLASLLLACEPDGTAFAAVGGRAGEIAP